MNKKEEIKSMLDWLEIVINNGIEMGYGKNQSASEIINLTVRELFPINSNVIELSQYRKNQ